MSNATLPNGWEIVELKSIATPIYERVGERIIETLSISAGKGFVNQAIKFGKELSGNQYKKYIVLRKGDFSYNKGNSKKYPCGCICLLKNREIAAVPSAFYCFKIADQCSDFFEQLFMNGHLSHQLSRVINIGVRNDGLFNLYEKDFYKCTIPLPPLAEQCVIAEILTTADKLIAVKERLIVAKKKQKRWLIQNLLTGKIRLPGFNGEWKKVKLKNLCKLISDGDWIESKDQSENGYRLIQVGNIGVNEFIDKPKFARFVSDKTFNLLKCVEVFCGDVLLSRLPNPIGRCCIIKRLNGKAITAVDCTILRFFSPIMAELFVQFASTDIYFNMVSKLAGGSTRIRIGRKEIERLSFVLPIKTNEQCAIVSVLTAADREIELLTKELEQHKLIKKHLMQQLLTGKIRVDSLIPQRK